MAPPPPTQSRPRSSHTFLEPSPPASSSSAFRPGTATTDTLAPGLSGTGSFSADEVLASEVLRDLMKSPMSVVRPGMSRGDSGELRPAHPSIPVQEDGVENLQREERSRGKKRDNESNAVLLGNHQNEWGLMGGTDGFGSTRTDTPIEESPAAIALADYFNKGGVGGISALDLGFPTEPALFADWILNPSNTPFQDEADQRFEISEQMFHLACSSLALPRVFPYSHTQLMTFTYLPEQTFSHGTYRPSRRYRSTRSEPPKPCYRRSQCSTPRR